MPGSEYYDDYVYDRKEAQRRESARQEKVNLLERDIKILGIGEVLVRIKEGRY